MKTDDQFPDVEPVMGRVLCYHVNSRRPGQPPYLVDWAHEPPYCTCNDFFKTHQRREESTGKRYLCFHMERSRDYGWAIQREIAASMSVH